MEKLNKVKVIRISETQHNTLVKMKSYNVDVGNFIRNSIKEKIERDYSYLIDKKHTDNDSFSLSLSKVISQLDLKPL